MKTNNTKSCLRSASALDTSINVEEEVRAIHRAGREIAKSQESARAFLHKAGIVTAKGNLSKKYRDE